MAMTAAEKQARYRERHLKEGDNERLQLVICLSAKRALERLARHHGLTMGAILERLVMDKQAGVTAGMDGEQYLRFYPAVTSLTRRSCRLVIRRPRPSG